MKKEIYVDIHDRLGNQLFSYAYARAMQIQQHPDYDLKLIFKRTSKGGKKSDGWDNSLKYFRLSDYEEVKNPLFTPNQIFAGICFAVMICFSRVVKKINPRECMQQFLNKEGIYTSYYSYWIKQYQSNNPKIYIRGRFEAYKYFEGIESMLKSEIIPKKGPLKKNKKLYQIIGERESVCISIRRGDFLEEKNKKFNVCDSDYFANAIDLMKKKVSNPLFIVFSDDIILHLAI